MQRLCLHVRARYLGKTPAPARPPLRLLTPTLQSIGMAWPMPSACARCGIGRALTRRTRPTRATGYCTQGHSEAAALVSTRSVGSRMPTALRSMHLRAGHRSKARTPGEAMGRGAGRRTTAQRRQAGASLVKTLPTHSLRFSGLSQATRSCCQEATRLSCRPLRRRSRRHPPRRPRRPRRRTRSPAVQSGAAGATKTSR